MTNLSPLKFRQAATRRALALLFGLLCAHTVLAQREAPASVSGRVTEGERPLAGVTVALLSNQPAQSFKTIARARTDAEGRYLLTGLAPGRYQILPFAPAHVVQGLMGEFPPGRPLTLLAGDEVRDLDFRVEPGAVITGRVTDPDGNPVVAEVVEVSNLTPNAPMPRGSFDMRDRMTDDRGVYRIYGLPAGRYRVSVGTSGEQAGTISFGRRRIFRRTFHPDTTDEAEARVVEVRPGEEADEVDITVGRALKTYRASGRFVSAETGQPVPNVVFGYGTLDRATQRIASFGGGVTTNAGGEFRTEGLSSGRYAVFAMPEQDGSEFYSDPVTFEVTDADVTGLVVRLKRGASVSGVVQIEGAADRATAARLLSQVRIYGWMEMRGQQLGPSGSTRSQTLGPDGGFRLAGLRPGRLRLGQSADGAKGLTLARVELNGASVTGGIEVAEGAQVTGVRMVLAYGTATLTGQTTFLNGTPQGLRIIATARRVSVGGFDLSRTVEVDARGFFRIEGLPAGQYEVAITAFGRGHSYQSEPQTVSVADGLEMKVAPVLDLR